MKHQKNRFLCFLIIFAYKFIFLTVLENETYMNGNVQFYLGLSD